VLLHDCQYTDDEYTAKVGWGHSSVSQVATFADKAKVDRLVLFHHDPMHTDEQIDAMVRAVAASRGDGGEVIAAAEGMTLEI
jgi:ribonuclease BN (tRNA processing enzyme)